MPVLNGKVAIVTGGGRGLGRAHAEALARAGAAVVVNDLGGELGGDGTPSSGPADEAVQAITAAGGRAAANTTDISDWDAVEGLIASAVGTFGRLDIVVNNAGISRFAPIDAVTRFDWERTINVALNGTAAVSHWAAAYWRKQGPEAGRRIINTSSGVGLTPMPGNPMYAAAKAGVAALTITSAMELADLGVRVNGIAPVARTRISEVVAGPLMANIPQGFDRLSPEHAATLVTYLASPDLRFTGRIFGVVGDDITVFDGWTVGRHLHNEESNWTVESLTAALAEIPVQHFGTAQGIKATEAYASPADFVLDALALSEKA